MLLVTFSWDKDSESSKVWNLQHRCGERGRWGKFSEVSLNRPLIKAKIFKTFFVMVKFGNKFVMFEIHLTHDLGWIPYPGYSFCTECLYARFFSYRDSGRRKHLKLEYLQ